MSRVLVPVELLEGETVSSGLLSLLGTVDVTVLGYHVLPEQTPPDQARLQFEERATDALEDLSEEFRAAGGAADHRLVFTHDREQTLERVADETNARAFAITGVTGDVDRLLVSLSGDVAVDRILTFVDEIVGGRDIGVTLYLADETFGEANGDAVDGGDADATVSGDADATVSGDADATVGGDADATVSGDADATVGGDADTTVSGDADATVGGDDDATVGGDADVAEDTGPNADMPAEGTDPEPDSAARLAAAATRLRDAGIEVETVLATDASSLDGLLEALPGHDAIVMSENAPSFRSVVFGDDSERVASASLGPVLVVRYDETLDG